MAKNLVLWLIIVAVLLTVFQNFSPQTTEEKLAYSDFVSEVQADQVREVTIDGLIITGERHDGSYFEAVRPQLMDDRLMDDLLSHGVSVKGRQPEQAGGGRDGPMSFGKSKARLLGEDQIKTTFADVAGVDEAKEEVQELVE